ncbi:MAG TPA: hypothetical protein VED65_00540 [Candidatus Bathyarchaeia archaeon]|nr:hypothetical protein [Candidatus Bathyarchaeia archaeon]
MNKVHTQIYRFQERKNEYSECPTAVSLHSHTMHSKERLGRLPNYMSKIPIGSYIIERELGRLHLYHGRIFNFNNMYWTPPLSPREAYELECKQIEEQLGRKALVSLTDHDSMEAGLQLRLLEKTNHVPVSTEWTVPYEKTEFHVGVHNLPAARSSDWAKELAAYRQKPCSELLRQILAGLHDEKDILIVLNHPYWDSESIGPAEHLRVLKQFLNEHLRFIHAIELNGMRSRRENRDVVALGEALERPVVSGGDRHGLEPNAVVNVSRAETFEEFVHEIRNEKRSEIVMMPQFFDALPLRLIDNAWHALSDAPGEFGRRHWMTRVFIEENGEAKALSHFNGTRFHRVVDKFRWVIGLVANPALRPALRLPFLGYEEGGL